MSLLSDLKLYYFDFDRVHGFAESIKLMLEDQEIPHEYIQLEYNSAEWDDFKEKLWKEGIPFDCLPYLKLTNGEEYFCSSPIQRVLAKKSGLLDGVSEKDAHFLDSCEDLVKDWYEMFVFTNISPAPSIEAKDNFKQVYCPKSATRFERIFSAHGGPYLLGSKISHVDYEVYHFINEQRAIIGDLEVYPHIAKFVTAFEERPNIKKYLASIVVK